MRFLMIALLVASCAGAQSRPASMPAAIDALMARTRHGDVEIESVRAVVTALLAGPHVIAAPWWIDLAAESDAASKLLPAEREVLARLRAATERSEAFAAEEKVILRVVRHVESLVAARRFDAARDAASVAAALLALARDPALAKLLAAARQRIPAAEAGGGTSAAAIGWPAGLEAEAAAAWSTLLAQGVEAYGVAGCGPGRHALARAIRDAEPLAGPPAARAALARLRALVRQVEPESFLTVFLRTVGTARVLVDGTAVDVTGDGTPIAADTGRPVTIACVPGDVVTIVLGQPYAEDDAARSFVVALHARIEGRDVLAEELWCEVGSEPGQGAAPLLPAPIARKKPNPPPTLFGQGVEQDEALRKTNAYFELPKTATRAVDVPCLPDMIAFLAEFDARRLAPLLLGTEADHFAIVFHIPGK